MYSFVIIVQSGYLILKL